VIGMPSIILEEICKEYNGKLVSGSCVIEKDFPSGKFRYVVFEDPRFDFMSLRFQDYYILIGRPDWSDPEQRGFDLIITIDGRGILVNKERIKVKGD